MAFTDFTNKEKLLAEFDLNIHTRPLFFRQSFYTELENAYFDRLLEIATLYREGFKSSPKQSENSIEISIIAPVLNVVLQHFKALGGVWKRFIEHKEIEALRGFPDCSIGWWNTNREQVMDTFLIVEVKKEKFEEAEGQCLAAMYAEALNYKRDMYGAVTSGGVWHFMKYDISDKRFIYDDIDYAFNTISIKTAMEVVGILHGLMVTFEQSSEMSIK